MQYVICLNATDGKDYSCYEDWQACPGNDGGYPAFIPNNTSPAATDLNACESLLTWDICADDYDAICILSPLDCPLGYAVSFVYAPLDYTLVDFFLLYCFVGYK